MHELDDHLVTPELARLRALPTSKLAGGRSRDRLAAALAATPELWSAVRQRLMGTVGGEVDEWFQADGPAEGGRPSAPPVPREQDDAGASQAEIERLKERARGFQEQRDDLQRRVDGAEARAAAAEDRLADSQRVITERDDTLAELEQRLRSTDDERRRAVERERRRNESEVARLQEELREVRRSLQERDRELTELRRRAANAVHPPPRTEEPRDGDATDGGFVEGRPSQLPALVRPGTRDAAELLLGRGRHVVVDGYNVTLTHREQLGLAEQRSWLLRLLSGAAAGRGIDPLVVWDGERGTAGGERARGVSVVFAHGHAADDEIEFHVAALPAEQPVTVVTDDRELRDRVRRYGADVMGTAPFLWVVE